MAINLAVDRCIQEDILREFLKENRSEVVKVTQLDYTFDRQIELERADARIAGREEGRAEGEQLQLIKMVCKKMEQGWNIERIAEEYDEKEAVIEKILYAAKSCAPEYDPKKIYDKIVVL